MKRRKNTILNFLCIYSVVVLIVKPQNFWNYLSFIAHSCSLAFSKCIPIDHAHQWRIPLYNITPMMFCVARSRGNFNCNLRSKVNTYLRMAFCDVTLTTMNCTDSMYGVENGSQKVALLQRRRACRDTLWERKWMWVCDESIRTLGLIEKVLKLNY